MLPVDHQQRGLAGDLIKPGLDIDDRADEMPGHLFLVAGTDDVIPELPAFRLSPAVGALVDRDNELRRFLQELEELGLSGLHLAVLSSNS